MKKSVDGIAVKCFDGLPDEARAIRQKVFVEEQGFMDEFDDADASARHLVALDDGKPVGTCRFFPIADGAYIIGRIAVVAECRGKGIGALLVLAAEREIALAGGSRALIHGQTRVRSFYEKLGYTPFGDPDDEEGVPHIWLQKSL